MLNIMKQSYFILIFAWIHHVGALANHDLSHPIQNSIIPIMEHFESIEHLPFKKFNKKQHAEISKALEKKEEKIRLVTYNMLLDLNDHNLEEINRWPHRLPHIVALIHNMKPDIICTQELYPNQALDLQNLLNEEFLFFPGCLDAAGESYGIFYRKTRFELLNRQFKKPLSLLQLKDTLTNKTISIFNTHLSFSNIEKRASEAHKIVKIITPYTNHGAVLLTGDLNTFPTRLDLDLPFYDGDSIHRILSKAPIKETSTRSLLGHFGPISTFTNDSTSVTHTPFKGTGTPGIILDSIYASYQVTILTHATESGTVKGNFPSDHMPVLIDFIIK